MTPVIAAALGLRALIDQTDPASFTKSLSNVPVTGILGIKNPRSWDMENPNTEAGYLNSNEVTTLIQYQGFRFWGNRTCSSEPLFAFETVARSAQFLIDTIVVGVFPFVDRPLTPILVRDIIDSINAKLRELVSRGWYIGASVWYNEAENSAQGLSQGQLWIDYDYTPVPTLENLGLNQRITNRHLVDFSRLVAQAA